jgi:hypothetical protein
LVLRISLLPSILQAIGISVISFGAGLVFIPAGILLAGVGILLFGLALDKGGK